MFYYLKSLCILFQIRSIPFRCQDMVLQNFWRGGNQFMSLSRLKFLILSILAETANRGDNSTFPQVFTCIWSFRALNQGRSDSLEI